MMFKLKSKLMLSLLVLSFGFTTLTSARDITMEQTSTSAARSDFENAQADYDDVTQRVNELEKRIAQDQVLLKAQQAKQAAAQTKLLNAKIELEKKQKILNKAWEERNK